MKHLHKQTQTNRGKKQTCQRRRPAASSAAPCVWSLHSHDSSLAELVIYTQKYLQRIQKELRPFIITVDYLLRLSAISFYGISLLQLLWVRYSNDTVRIFAFGYWNGEFIYLATALIHITLQLWVGREKPVRQLNVTALRFDLVSLLQFIPLTFTNVV